LENEKVIQTYVKSCATITNTLLSILSDKLNLKDPDHPSLHKFGRPAGNQMRIIKYSASETRTVEQVACAGTDFGSLTGRKDRPIDLIVNGFAHFKKGAVP
jgi:isopenicillin N synthase-like dioxygenase